MRIISRSAPKVNQLALATLLVVSAGAALAREPDHMGYLQAPVSDNVIVRSGFGLCWHTGYWTPAMAIPECDEVAYVAVPAKPVPAAVVVPAPAPTPEPKPVVKPAPPPPAPLPPPRRDRN